MRTLLYHGEACTQLIPRALSIHPIKGPLITVSNKDLVLREYDSMLDRSDRLGESRAIDRWNFEMPLIKFENDSTNPDRQLSNWNRPY